MAKATRKAQVFDAEAFGKALKIKRTIQNNFTVRDVVDVLNVPASTISRIERALPAEMNTVFLVCDWLGKSVCDFIIYERKPAFPVIID